MNKNLLPNSVLAKRDGKKKQVESESTFLSAIPVQIDQQKQPGK